ncbi:MAG: response regulator, partial [Thermoanaerobaculia bacterium]|nr:response regulator [Thermoanaerobaculia bacterium]
MPKKILLADDSITIQKVVELTFSDGDYEVVATNNGANAIEEIPKVGPDIILSDIIMPEKNGYEVCEWVKSSSEHRHIPVILLTGTFEPFDPDRAEKAGCDAVVTKPFESQSLIQKVEELIGDRGGEEPPAEEPSVGQPSAEEQPLGEPSPTPPQPEAPEEVPPPPPPAPEQTEAAPEQEGPAFELGEPSAEPSRPFEEAPPEPSASQAETPFPPETEEPKPQGDVFGAETQP